MTLSGTTRKLLIVIPSYNEEANLPTLIPAIRREVPGADILIVDDCSKDRTAETARALGAFVARHPVNLGYGAGLMTGYKFADRYGYDALVQMDGDGQHDPASIGPLVRALEEGNDLVLGSRFQPGVRRYRAQRLRAIGMRIFGGIASRALGIPISDPTSGFQALSRRLVTFHARGTHFPQDYPDADILILVGRMGFRIREIGVTMYEKPGGASIHSGWKPIYYVFKMTLSILLVLTGPRREAAGAP